MGANEKHAATYHGGEYTPTTDELRDIWVDYNLNPLPRSQGIPLVETAQAEFDRWLETVRAEAKAEALQDAADEVLGYDPRVSLRGIYAALKFRANQYKENQS